MASAARVPASPLTGLAGRSPPSTLHTTLGLAEVISRPGWTSASGLETDGSSGHGRKVTTRLTRQRARPWPATICCLQTSDQTSDPQRLRQECTPDQEALPRDGQAISGVSSRASWRHQAMLLVTGAGAAPCARREVANMTPLAHGWVDNPVLHMGIDRDGIVSRQHGRGERTSLAW